MSGPRVDEQHHGRLIGGKYRVVRLLGEGGMGAVYEAENTSLGVHVAVKVLRPEFTLRTDAVSRFRQEARTTAKIGHPNIVSILDLERDPADGSLYMVQELLAGTDLRKHLDAVRRMDPRAAVDLCLPVLSALAAAHERGVLHRDLKPANIFLCSNNAIDGTLIPKVIDFGIAKVMSGDDETGHTRDGMLLGTLSYMAPEQLTADPTLDGRADVWAMGCVLYEMIAGEPPFKAPPAAASNLVAIAEFARRVNHEPAPRLESRAPAVPVALAEIVHTAIATDRAARFGTMRHFQERVLAWSTQSRTPTAQPPVAGPHESTVLGLEPEEVSFVGASAPGPIATPSAPPVPPVRAQPAAVASPRSTEEPTAVGRPMAQVPERIPAGAPLPAPPMVRLLAAAPSPPPPASDSKRRRVLFAGLGVGALLLTAATVALVAAPKSSVDIAPAPPPAPPAVSVEPTPAPPQPAPEAPLFDFQITSVPAGASVTRVGSEEVEGETPLTLRLPPSSTPVKFVVRLPGHADQTVEFAGTAADSKAVKLVPKKGRKTAPPPSAPSRLDPRRIFHVDMNQKNKQ